MIQGSPTVSVLQFVSKGRNPTKINESFFSEWMVTKTEKSDFNQLVYLNWLYSALIHIISPIILSLLLKHIILPQATKLR